MKTIEIELCDYTNITHQQAIADLISAYIADEMGGGTVLNQSKKVALVDALKNHPTAIVLLAISGDVYCGLLVAFENVATFAVSPMINIHDLIVLPGFRGRGVGRKLLEKIASAGKERNCCRLTLEVRKDNVVAQKLYKSEGFDDTDPPMFYWRKQLD